MALWACWFCWQLPWKNRWRSWFLNVLLISGIWTISLTVLFTWTCYHYVAHWARWSGTQPSQRSEDGTRWIMIILEWILETDNRMPSAKAESFLIQQTSSSICQPRSWKLSSKFFSKFSGIFVSECFRFSGVYLRLSKTIIRIETRESLCSTNRSKDMKIPSNQRENSYLPFGLWPKESTG